MKKIYIIDGYNFLYRLFYAIPPFSLKDGTPVNTVFGLAKLFISLYNEDKPDYLFFVLDSPHNFREAIYSEYKGTRDRMPDNLRIQEKLVFELLEAAGIKPLALDGYEADDIIGTLATKFEADPEMDTYILSGDKDLHQFVGPRVAVYDTMKRIVYRAGTTEEKFGVAPVHVVDYLSIVGDSSDNIPGISGFGPKKAQELIKAYGTLEQIYENLDKVSEKTRLTLEENRERAFLSKRLATIDVHVPINVVHLNEYAFRERPFFTPEIIAFLQRFNFRSLLPKEHDQINDITSLGLKQIELTQAVTLDELSKNITALGKVSIATYGTGFSLEGGSLYLGGNDVYQFQTDKIEMQEFFKKLLESDTEIIGYGLKEDIKRIQSYIDNFTVSSEKSQGSLF